MAKFDETSISILEKSSFKIYGTTAALPDEWDVIASSNIFLTTSYLSVLEQSAPENMTCHFIGLFEDSELMGIAVSQFLDLNKLQSFGERDRCLKTSVRNFVFRNFCSHVLFIGNNMLTGQNAFVFSKQANVESMLKILRSAAEELKKVFGAKGKKIHLLSFKDFYEDELSSFNNAGFANSYRFSTQPNMIFPINENWSSEVDYIDALSKKYRDQYKRARKKAAGIEKRKMHLDDIAQNQKTINELYFHVAKNAPFNTFFLSENHFFTLKKILKDKFLFYGYFVDGKLIGFNTLIKNGDAMDTYFLGYDESIQKEKMLYLNMLYDMIAYSINKGFKEIVFARTALEIKSSVGAIPVKMYGFLEHSNALINRNIAQLFGYLEPEAKWQQRNPFKDSPTQIS